jgi:hypothetical protein
MQPVTSEVILTFLRELSQRSPAPATIYLLGGGALCLLGSPRVTRDLDYMIESASGSVQELEVIAADLAQEKQLDIEQISLSDFIPLPPDAVKRRRALFKSGNLDIYIFDLYSIALSKIARGFETDFEDIMFMLQNRLIDLSTLTQLAQVIEPNLAQSDVNPVEFRIYLEEIRHRANK